MSAGAIRELNDAFRTTFIGGRVMLSAAVAGWPIERQAEILRLVREFDSFAEENDPHHEHDFGAFLYEDIRHFWKIDYYDASGQFGSEDPANAEITLRILTIMEASEY